MTVKVKAVRDRFSELPPTPHVVTIGNFDGVHRGHQYLLGVVVERAGASAARSLVVTFEPHPVSVLRPEPPFKRIASPDAKLELIAAQGIDDILVVTFDRAFASLTPEEFLELIRAHAQPVEVIVGDGFRFGKGRSGDGDTIRRFAQRHGFEANIVERISSDSQEISSSVIRRALANGDVELAANVLGRRFRLAGVVEHGFSRGQDLGVPTANLQVAGDLLIPGDGIYAGYVHRLDRRARGLPAMVYIGTSPTFGAQQRAVEANILDFDGDLYARGLEIEFVSYVRGDARFDTAEELVEQMRHDERVIRDALAANPSESEVPE